MILLSLIIENIKKRAKENKKTIVLPETMDRRVLEATDKILKEDIADIILIGNKKDIEEKAKDLDISEAKIIEPIDNELTAQLAEKLYEIRKEKDTKSDPDCSGCTEVFVCTVFALCSWGGTAWGRCEDIHRMQY